MRSVAVCILICVGCGETTSREAALEPSAETESVTDRLHLPDLPVVPASYLRPERPERVDFEGAQFFEVREPPLHLHVFHFASASHATASLERLLDWAADYGRLREIASAVAGGHLLIVGTPHGSEPTAASRRARDRLVAAFRGHD